MQILVVVAITYVRTIWTDVEKGSVATAFVHGLVGPKATMIIVKAVLGNWHLGRKGIQRTFCNHARSSGDTWCHSDTGTASSRSHLVLLTDRGLGK